MGKPDDTLDALFEELLQRCKQKNLTVFRGDIDPEAHAVVDWDEAAGDVWAFLDAAVQVGTRMVYVQAWRFTEDDLESALEEEFSEESDDESGGASEPVDPEWRQQLEAFREHVGKVSSLQVLFRFDGVFHAWTTSSDWYDAFCALRDEEEDEFLEEAEEDYDYREARQERQRLVTEAATALANDPRFAECRNQPARLALLRRVKPDIADEFPSEFAQRAVIQEAQAIFELDVRPKLRADPRQRVLDLKQQGFTLSQIAAKVSLKSAEVKKLLEEE
jgi:hypothetical protein